MSLEQIKGQDTAIQMLRSALGKKRLSHAYLFSGPAGTGKVRTAETFAQAIFCTEKIDDACGECVACRKVKHGNHPDLYKIEPDGNSIKIDQIRSLQRNFSNRSSGNGYKVYIIVHADKMTKESANSLLKFLEEPLSPVVAILISDNGHAVLPTLQSRSQWVSFVPLAPEQMLAELKREGYDATLARTAAHLVSGVEAAKNLIQQTWFAELRNIVIKLMKECKGQTASASLLMQSQVMKSELAEHVDVLLDLIVLMVKDMLMILSGRSQQAVFLDQNDWLAGHAYTRRPDEWLEAMELVIDAKKRLRANVNAQLVLEQLWVRLHA